MQFTTTTLAAIMAITSVTTASPLLPRQSTTCTAVTSGPAIVKISNFYARKLNGLSGGVSTASFTITNTTDSTSAASSSSCSPHDVSTGAAVGTGLDGSPDFQDNVFYSCGADSQYDFAYNDASSGLLLKMKGDDEQEFSVGTTTTPVYCHAGGSSASDYVCSGVSDEYVTLVGYPSA